MLLQWLNMCQLEYFIAKLLIQKSQTKGTTSDRMTENTGVLIFFPQRSPETINLSIEHSL